MKRRNPNYYLAAGKTYKPVNPHTLVDYYSSAWVAYLKRFFQAYEAQKAETQVTDMPKMWKKGKLQTKSLW